MKVRPSVVVVQHGKLLTMRYQFGGHNVFALPGGNPDPGEGLSTTISRELKEELGVIVKVDEVLLTGEVLSWGTREDVLHFIFAGQIIEGSVALDPLHTSALEVVWLDCDTLADHILYPNVGIQLKEIFGGRRPAFFMEKIEQPMC